MTSPHPITIERKPAVGLTPRMLELKSFIASFEQDHGVMPTFREMASGTGLASISNIYRLLDGLEERGHIRRLPNRARAIALVGNEAA